MYQTAETKQKYTEIDERAITPGTNGMSEKSFLAVERWNPSTALIDPKNETNPTREGAEICPQSFSYRGWLRPRALANDGQADDKKSEQFNQALYVRVIFTYTSTVNQSQRMPNVALDPNNDNFFLGPNGLPVGQDLGYEDIYKPLNWKVTGKPLMDKVIFIPNQYGMNNTKLIKFNHRFSKNEKLSFLNNPATVDSANSAYPDKILSMFIFARYADDDTHIQYENLEAVGTGIFKFKDF